MHGMACWNGFIETADQLASYRCEGEGQNAGSEEQPGGWLRYGVGRKGESVDREWSDIDGIVRIEDIDVIGAVVVDVGEAGSDGTAESEEIAQGIDVRGGGIGEDEVVVGDAGVGPDGDDAGEGVALTCAGDAGEIDRGIGGVGEVEGAVESAADGEGCTGSGAGGAGADGEGVGVGAGGESGRRQKG